MSVSQIAKKGCILVFDKFCCKIYNAEKKLVAYAPLVDDLYRMNVSLESTQSALVAMDKQLWHRRMGHTCDANLAKLKSAADGIEYKNCDSEKCIVCIQGKHTRASFSESDNRASNVLDLVHSDVAFMPKNSNQRFG